MTDRVRTSSGRWVEASELQDNARPERRNTGTTMRSREQAITTPARRPDTPPPQTSRPTTLQQGGGITIGGGQQIPTPTKKTGIVIGPNTNLRAIVKHFQDIGADPEKALRLKDRGNGFKELHLHEGTSRIGHSGSRSAKQKEAADYISQKLESALGSKGAADRVLARSGVTDRGKHTEISVASLINVPSRIAAELEADARAMQSARFGDGRAHLGDHPNVKFSEGGAGGALLATKDGPAGRTGVVLKIEGPVENTKTGYVADLAKNTLANLSTPFPFVVPQFETLHLPPNSPDRQAIRDKLTAIINDPNADEDRVDAATTQRTKLDQHGIVAKMEFLDGGTINTLSGQERLALFKDPQFAQALGKAGVIFPMLGLDDHGALDGFGGKVNLANLIKTADGTLGIIDFDAFMYGTDKTGRRFGVTDESMKKGVTQLLDFVKDLASPKTGAAMLDKVMKDWTGVAEYGEDPLVRIMELVVNPDRGKQGLLDWSPGSGAADLSKQDFQKFALNLARGALDGLAYLRENIGAFQAAHEAAGQLDNAQDPAGTFKWIAKTIDGADIDKLRARLDDLHAG